jgi:hypothetical protein
MVEAYREGIKATIESRLVRILSVVCSKRIHAERTVLVPGPHERLAGDGLTTPLALAIHPPQPVHRHDVSSRSAGNDRVAGPGLDWEVMRAGVTRLHYDWSIDLSPGMEPVRLMKFNAWMTGVPKAKYYATIVVFSFHSNVSTPRSKGSSEVSGSTAGTVTR